MSRIDIAKPRVKLAEGKRRRAYSDATAKTVTCQPAGNLTIGYGVNLEAGLDDVEIEFLLQHRLELADQAISGFWWMAKIDDPRGSVVLEIAYNAGVANLLHFPKMLAAIGAAQWQAAHDELLDSDAARQLPARYAALGVILLSGVA